MTIKATYTHTNLTGHDWQGLVRFYCKVFGCTPKPPQRDLSGEWLEQLTAIPNAQLKGMHLLLPGCGANGPTLEIFQYDEMLSRDMPVVNQPGFGHIAFHVDDVQQAVTEIKAHGGSLVGQIVKTEVPGVGILRVAYARDPEGNIIEVQNWSKDA
jgi:predicted enzyme related to lactoylglutathione lyase